MWLLPWFCQQTIHIYVWNLLYLCLKAKSRKYQGVFEVKSRVKTWQFEEFGLNNWSISKSQNGGRNQVWHCTSIVAIFLCFTHSASVVVFVSRCPCYSAGSSVFHLDISLVIVVSILVYCWSQIVQKTPKALLVVWQIWADIKGHTLNNLDSFWPWIGS